MQSDKERFLNLMKDFEIEVRNMGDAEGSNHIEIRHNDALWLFIFDKKGKLEDYCGNAILNEVWETIRNERKYQDKKWGGKSHDDKHSHRDWCAFIVAYLGSCVKCGNWVLDASFRENMVKVAALAVAAIEWVDRKGVK